MDTKVCRRCRLEKPLDDFPLSSLNPGPVGKGRHTYCRQCKRTIDRAVYDRQPEKWRAADLMRHYGITTEEYAGLHQRQNGRCAICGTEEPGKRRKYFCVDHDHKTGAVRGLLCVACNLMVGFAADDPARLNKAASYLAPAALSAA